MLSTVSFTSSRIICCKDAEGYAEEVISEARVPSSVGALTVSPFGSSVGTSWGFHFFTWTTYEPSNGIESSYESSVCKRSCDCVFQPDVYLSLFASHLEGGDAVWLVGEGEGEDEGDLLEDPPKIFDNAALYAVFNAEPVGLFAQSILKVDDDDVPSRLESCSPAHVKLASLYDFWRFPLIATLAAATAFLEHVVFASPHALKHVAYDEPLHADTHVVYVVLHTVSAVSKNPSIIYAPTPHSIINTNNAVSHSGILTILGLLKIVF